MKYQNLPLKVFFESVLNKKKLPEKFIIQKKTFRGRF